jgi:hypothetical protein
VAVLERQPDSVTAFDRAAHRVACHHPQQLAAGGLVRWRDAVVGELGAGGAQVAILAAGQLP